MWFPHPHILGRTDSRVTVPRAVERVGVGERMAEAVDARLPRLERLGWLDGAVNHRYVCKCQCDRELLPQSPLGDCGCSSTGLVANVAGDGIH